MVRSVECQVLGGPAGWVTSYEQTPSLSNHTWYGIIQENIGETRSALLRTHSPTIT